MDFFTTGDYSDERPKHKKIIFWSTVIGGFFSILGLIIYFLGFIRGGGLTFIIGLLISIIPYGIINFLKNRKIREAEKQFPIFLDELAESKRGGMTIIDAFQSATESDYGALDSEVNKVYTQLTWGIPFPDVMERFSKRMKGSPVMQESISIIIQSFQSGGDITNTIESVSDNAAELRDIVHEKTSKLKQKLFIMYIIYFLFIGITIGIYMMLAQLIGFGSQASGALSGVEEVLGSSSSGPTNYCGQNLLAAEPFCSTAKIFGFIPSNITDLSSSYATNNSYGKMAYYKSVLFTMLMMQGICTAAVAGKIREGSASAGIKHAMVLIPVAFTIFMLVVRPMGL